MNEAVRIIKEMRESTPTERRRALKPYADKKGIGAIVSAMKEEKEKRMYIRALCDMAAAPAVAEIIKGFVLEDRKLFVDLLSGADAKLRKNTVELIGRAAPVEMKEELLDTLVAEETLFVIPSIILSLGNSKSEEVLEFLQSYRYPKAEPKHAEECRSALEKAISALSQDAESVWPRINEKDMLLLNCPSAAVTVRELQALRISSKPMKGLSNCVSATGIANYKEIYEARTFYDASIYYKSAYDTAGAADILRTKEFADFCKRIFGDKLRVRIDVQDFPESEKRTVASWFASKLNRENGFINSPSSYNFLIRIMAAKNEVHIMLTPSSRLDARFSYKVESVPASIHPAAAAAVSYLALPYLKKNAKIADPFCGSGTMLFERAKHGYQSLTGMDISQDALKAARANEKAARTGAHFLIKNAKTPFREQYDEIICNMPFGLRVSSHENNEDLYRQFADNLKTVLKPEGIAMLFTHDKKLMAAVIPDGYKILQRHTFSCGGLNPDLFIITKA